MMVETVAHIARGWLKCYQRNIAKEQYPLLTRFSRWKWQAKGAMGVVFMLHHVTQKDPAGIPTNQDLKVSPAFLEKIIIAYRNKGFDFISLDELSRMLSSDETPERPFVSFTMDDGYLDVYTQAFPVFKQYNVPFCVFVATDFVDKKAILWWNSLEKLILSNEEVMTSDGNRYPCRTYEQRNETFLALRSKIQKLNQQELEEELHHLFGKYAIDWRAPIEQEGISWELLKEMADDPLCTIGGHSVTHPALNMLDEDSLRKEIFEGVRKLEAQTGQKVQHFAYPYGSPNTVGEREYRLLKELAFKTAFCSSGGCICASDRKATTQLPRVYLNEEAVKI